MSAVDTRSISRDSLFMMADLRLDGTGDPHRVKVRNLSAGGMMAEGDMAVVRGARLEIELRNVGKIKGTVAWVQENRFGIAFASEIDPKLVRAPVGSGDLSTPRFVRPIGDHPGSDQKSTGNLRKI